MPDQARRFVLASRPVGEPKEADLRLETFAIPSPATGEALLRTLYLSLDPYMRGRMSEAKSYAAPVPVGGVMEGGTVSEVVASNNPAFSVGDIVLGRTGWQTHAVSDGASLRKVDPDLAPISTAVGVLGMPGMTAYAGLLEVGQPKAGETLVVAAASGAVGSVVGQIAKIKGLRAVGIAGGADKCRYVKDVLGFDDCLDHRAPDLPGRLAAACPNGIDVYFENVAGPVLDAVLPLLNTFARIPVCGTIAHYNDTAPPPGPDKLPAVWRMILTKRLTVRGLLVTDFAALHGDFLRDMGQWVKEGRVKYLEDIVDGFEKCPARADRAAARREFRQASGPMLTFASLLSVLFCECLHQRTTSKYWILVELWI